MDRVIPLPSGRRAGTATLVIVAASAILWWLSTYHAAAMPACQSAAADVNKAIGAGEYKKTALCLTSDSLNELADKNNISQK